MKSILYVLPAAAMTLLFAACQPDSSAVTDPRVDGIAATPAADPDLSILNDQHNAAAVRITPGSSGKPPTSGGGSPATPPESKSPESPTPTTPVEAPAGAPPAPPPPG